jgi:glutathione S-transferase
MLKLYHYWSSVCSQKVRMCLAEKRLAWESVHVDIFAFDNYTDWYTKLNPKAVVPTLDHNGSILIESNVILEYLEDNFPDAPLRPADLYERAQMRLWIYNSEEMAHWNLNTASHNLRHAKRLEQKFSRDEQLAAANRCPNPMISQRLRRRLEIGVSEQEEREAYERIEYLLEQMERQLTTSEWIAGATFSLADIALAPMINRVEVLRYPEMLSPSRKPGVADWWGRIQEKASYKEAFSFANPDKSDPIPR